MGLQDLIKKLIFELRNQNYSNYLEIMTSYINTGSGIKSSFLAGAFVESCRLLNQAEAARNAANLGVAAKNNITMTASFDNNVITINAALPVAVSLDASGKPVIDVTDYIGSAYSAFVIGTGDAKSTDLPSLALELAQKLGAAEKLVQPASDQPNNIQIDISLETGLATISANIPYTPTIGLTGEVTLTAQDYV